MKENSSSAARPRRRPSRRPGLTFAPLLFLVAVAGFYVWHSQRSRPDRARSQEFRQYLSDGRSRLVVYTPDASHSQSDVTRAQLRKLREKFDGLILYRSDAETEDLLNTAVEFQYRAALLTVWDPASKAEVRRAARLADEFHGKLAIAVSLGSEGLMENRYTTAELEQASSELDQATRADETVEITTTEPWWMYTRKTAEAALLRGFGDFTSVNIHVIWDTDIAGPAEAANWTADRAIEVQRLIGRPLLVREAGFPGGGTSPRKTAHFEFTRAMQAEFWSAWQRHRRGVPLAAAFEGVDNPAKQWADFESAWGFLAPDLKPYAVWDVIPALAAPSVGASR